MADLKISALTASTTPLAGTEVLPIVQSSTTKKVSVANLTAGRSVDGQSFSLDSASAGLPTTFGGIAHFTANDYTYVVAKSTGNGLILNNGTGSAAVRLLNPTGNGYIEFNTGAAGAITSSISSAGSFVPVNGQGIDFSATPGTGTSELLADYEEGTFTPTYVAATGTLGTVTYSNVKGIYTKVGRLVTVTGGFFCSAFAAGTGSGDLRITGLPFTNSSTVSAISVGDSRLFTLNNPTGGQVAPSDVYITLFYRTTANGGINNLQVSDAATGSGALNLVYFTASYHV